MFVLDKHHMAYRSTKDQRTPKHRFCPKDKLITSQDQEQGIWSLSAGPNSGTKETE